MPFAPDDLDTALATLAASRFIALHTADPGFTSGQAEVQVSGAPARVQTTWGAAADLTAAEQAAYGNRTGRKRVGSDTANPVPAATTVTHYSVNTAATGGRIVFSAPLPAAERFEAAGGTQTVRPTLLLLNG